MKKIINKKIKKLFDRECKFCGEKDYCTLDVHRIIEGTLYTDHNTVTTCANCHRKIHDGKILIDKKYFSTMGWILHYFDEDGKEHWK